MNTDEKLSELNLEKATKVNTNQETGGEGRSSLGYRPSGRWAFNGAVADCFDDMLARSIPELAAMRRAVFALGSRYVRPGHTILDLGCSRGGALAPFVSAFAGACPVVGVESSPPMAAACRGRFMEEIGAGRVEIIGRDLRHWYPDAPACLTLCVLTLQFVPVEHRQRLLRRAFENTRPGGALILVEKVLGEGALLDDAQVNCYYDFKRANGYTEAEIAAKRASLEGALVPLTARWNEGLLRGAGFRSVDGFWRWMNFAGWAAVKDEE